MVNIKTNKKGFINLFLFMIMGFILSITVVILYFSATTIYNHFIDNPEVLQNALPDDVNGTTLMQDTFGQVPNAYESLKWVTGVLLVGMIITILISAYLTKQHPVWFIVYLLAWIIAIILSAPMANTYHTIYQNPLLAASFKGFWAQNWIFNNLPVVIVVIGGVGALIMVYNMIKTQGGAYYG